MICHGEMELSTIQDDISKRPQTNDDLLPSSVEEGMPWPQAMAGVVRPARVSNHPAMARASASPPYPRRGVPSQTYVVVFNWARLLNRTHFSELSQNEISDKLGPFRRRGSRNIERPSRRRACP
jgi:hypothetical protein